MELVGVIGGGTMGAGIAISVLDAGLRVILLEQDDTALQRGVARVTEHYASRVSAGKMKAAVAAANEARLAPTTDWAQFAQVDLVIEAVFEDLAVKQEVFKKIDAFARAVVSSLGSTYGNAPANFYRSLREPTQRAEATPRARRRLHLPQVLLHVPHPHFHLPQRQARGGCVPLPACPSDHQPSGRAPVRRATAECGGFMPWPC